MYRTKKIFAAALAFLMLFSLLCITPTAEEDDKWLFINGVNITRRADTAIIYTGIATTGQTQWGHDLVIDADGVVTAIVEGGLAEGENLAVPEDGMVISAAGTKVQWLKKNIKKGDKVFYDSYTQRLFVCDKDGDFDPYYSKEINVSGDENYIVSNPTVSGVPTYTYDVAIDSDGTVVARGGTQSAPDDGFVISAATVTDKEFLVMYAPLGAKCKVEKGVAEFTYSQAMLKKTAELELERSEKIFENAKNAYFDIDNDSAETVLNEVKSAVSKKFGYKELVGMLESLQSGVNDICNETDANELRAAFHTPTETDSTAVRKTVRQAKENGLNTLFLRVSNGHGTFIPLPEDNKFKQDPMFGGFDVLKAYIDICKEENIALGLSVDVYYNESASSAAREWTTESNGEQNGIEDKYYSPASKEFKDYFIDYIEYIVSNYDITTILLDSLRYPKFHENCDIGYDYDTISRFAQEYAVSITEAEAIKTELFDSPHWQKWVEFRMGLVTDMANSVSECIRAIRTDINIIAVAARDSVDHYYMQDTITWLENEIIDGICLALYERDPAENDPIDELAYGDGLVTDKGEIIGSYTGKKSHFFTALEVSKQHTAETLANAISESRGVSADGFVFGSLTDYIAQNYYTSLSKSVMSNEAFSTIADTSETMKKTLEYSKNKINDAVLANGGCDENTASQALSKIGEALSLLESGVLTHEQASKLESDIAIIFASSDAKQTVLREFSAITKMALLYKEKSEVTPPDTDPNDEPSLPDESSESSSEGNNNPAGNAGIGSGSNSKKELNINIGNILIYAFVGLGSVAAVIAIFINLKRKNKRPLNSHMPKASVEEDQNENEE